MQNNGLPDNKALYVYHVLCSYLPPPITLSQVHFSISKQLFFYFHFFKKNIEILHMRENIWVFFFLSLAYFS